MTPIHFQEANTCYGPPNGLDKAQVRPIYAFNGEISGGSCDGLPFIVTAWKPSPEEIQRIVNGEPIFLSVIGGLPPHFLTTDFHSATNPA